MAADVTFAVGFGWAHKRLSEAPVPPWLTAETTCAFLARLFLACGAQTGPPRTLWRIEIMSKRTFQPHNTPRLRTHGYRVRSRTRAGMLVLKRRRQKGRKLLAPTTYRK